MIGGLYRVHFRTPIGEGAGVVYINDGRLRGGDTAMYYIGTYEINGDKIKATVNVDRHTQMAGPGSVFGVDKATIKLDGNINGESIITQGTAAEAPGVVFQAALDRISD